MKTITIVAEDRVGLLSDITYILGKERVNIESIDVSALGGKAFINLSIKKIEKAQKALENNGYKVMENNSLVLKLEDKPGELAKITKMLSDEGVNITNVHILSKTADVTVISVLCDKARKSKELLKDYLVENR